MRSHPTEAESVLWESLRRKQVGRIKFRRQHAIGPFIVDFYCPAARLVVEVDGPIHDLQQEYDEMRTAWLESLGLKVIRFRNEAVEGQLSVVMDTILSHVSPTSPPAPSPLRSEGESWP
ncbi:MAG: endonuclease domain-containing protein [Pleurocapsa minor GSE-CHR-MK-17-07R]|nr:endonuclease domain-containing protein [Pleurocapsa minor GSE-CHR-MK 17-07R]